MPRPHSVYPAFRGGRSFLSLINALRQPPIPAPPTGMSLKPPLPGQSERFQGCPHLSNLISGRFATPNSASPPQTGMSLRTAFVATLSRSEPPAAPAGKSPDGLQPQFHIPPDGHVPQARLPGRVEPFRASRCLHREISGRFATPIFASPLLPACPSGPPSWPH
jgi:hypothetical protein